MDGNKRTAVYLVELLAQRSGYRLRVDDLILSDVITDVARGEMNYSELATWFTGRLERVATDEPEAFAPGIESTDDQ